MLVSDLDFLFFIVVITWTFRVHNYAFLKLFCQKVLVILRKLVSKEEFLLILLVTWSLRRITMMRFLLEMHTRNLGVQARMWVSLVGTLRFTGRLHFILTRMGVLQQLINVKPRSLTILELILIVEVLAWVKSIVPVVEVSWGAFIKYQRLLYVLFQD